ncbi:hypothetical protein MP638_000342 [Amoeboaphelidium occidentale]|nr:hypothetical protein MP638_000342 [Amoeboaphelidium occidentale]
MNSYVTFEQLESTPSRQSGVSKYLEDNLRYSGCDLIHNASRLLRLNDLITHHAMVLFNRFYFVHSFTEHDLFNAAMASCFVAAKCNDSVRRLRDVVNVFYCLRGANDSKERQHLDLYSNEFYELRNALMQYEMILLQSLAFNISVDHVEPFLLCFLNMLQLSKFSDEIMKYALCYLNDSSYSIAGLCFSPETIACSCIYLGCLKAELNFETKPPFWEVFGVKTFDLKYCMKMILALYQLKRVTVPLTAAELVSKQTNAAINAK